MVGKIIIYSALAGVIGNFLFGPKPADPVGAAFIFAFLALIIYYPLKALAVTCGTVKRMRAEGKPLFEAGGLTEYDSEFARQVGEAAAKATRENKS